MLKKALHLSRICIIAAKNTFKNEGTIMAAALSFYAFFSLFPIILIFFSILGFVVSSPNIARNAADFLKDFFPASTTSIQRSIDYAFGLRHKVGIIGFLFLFPSAIYFFTALEEAINKAWKVESERHLIRKKFLSVAIMFIAGIILLVSVFMMSFFSILSGFTMIPELLKDILPMQTVIYISVTSLTSFFLFLSFYKFLPNTEIKMADIIPGTLITTVIWEILLYCFTLSLKYFTDYQILYGPVATLITMLSWIYISCFLIIGGAEFCSEYANQKKNKEAFK